MAATTTTTLISGGSNSYLASEALVELVGKVAAQRSNMPETMWVKTLIGDSTTVAHYRQKNALTVSTATEGSALPVVQWLPTGETITAGLDGIAIQLTTLVNSISPEVLGDIAQEGGNAIYRAVDKSACALFPSLTAGNVGATGTALTVAKILTANANLDAAHADEVSPYVGRLHPIQFGDLYQDILTKNFGIAKISVDSSGRDVIEIGGTILKRNSLVSTINSGADYAGAIYSNQAMGLVIAMSPNVVINPIPGSAAYSIDCTVAFGVGVTRATQGALVYSGVTA